MNDNEVPEWTITTTAGEQFDITGVLTWEPDWVLFKLKIAPGVQHIVAMFPTRNVLAVTSHAYVPEEER